MRLMVIYVCVDRLRMMLFRLPLGESELRNLENGRLCVYRLKGSANKTTESQSWSSRSRRVVGFGMVMVSTRGDKDVRAERR